MLVAAPCWPQKNPCHPGLAEPLRATALALIEDIAHSDAEPVLRVLAKEGLAIGDNSPIPVARVKRQFAAKAGLFCLFFDSSCMQERANKSLWSEDKVLGAFSGSYREWLERAGSPKLEVVFLDAPVTDYCGASVTVFPERASTPATIEFGFVYRHGAWELAQIGEMP